MTATSTAPIAVGPACPALSHDAMFYGSDEQFVDALVPFIRGGLARGEGVAAAVTAGNIALLRDALGVDAGAVEFLDREEWYRRPAVTVAGWQSVLARAAQRGHRRVRLIGEVNFGAGGGRPTWSRYEAALNRVFADAPAWIVCPYDTRALPAAVVADARRTHPAVFGPGRRDSDAYVAPEEFLRAVPEPMPPVSGPPALAMPLGDEVSAVRRAVRDLVTVRLPAVADRLDDLLLAVSEIVSNALRYGVGPRDVRVWLPGDAVVCEVTDGGPGPPDPLVGYRPPTPRVPGGRGLWIAHQLCDALAIDVTGGTTRVRLAVCL